MEHWSYLCWAIKISRFFFCFYSLIAIWLLEKQGPLNWWLAFKLEKTHKNITLCFMYI